VLKTQAVQVSFADSRGELRSRCLQQNGRWTRHRRLKLSNLPVANSGQQPKARSIPQLRILVRDAVSFGVSSSKFFETKFIRVSSGDNNLHVSTSCNAFDPLTSRRADKRVYSREALWLNR